MPRQGRATRPAAPKSAKAPKTRVSAKQAKKSKSRALDAFAIALRENPDKVKIGRHRLGESDIGSSHGKRRRDDDDEDEEEEEEEGRKRHKRRQAGDDELSYDEGSDSEGNNWTMGHVDSEDDEEIDSDEAFGESDEERFEGWTFRGSSSNKKGKPKKKPARAAETDGSEDIDLDEDDEEGEDSDLESLGSDAVDLATMLDQYEESEEERKSKKSKKKSRDMSSDDEPSEEGFSDEDGASDLDMSDDEDADPNKIAQLRNLISSLRADEEDKEKKPKGPEAHEHGAPSEFGVFRKVDLTALKSKISDPEKRKSLKLLEDNIKSTKRNSIARKLDAPLPKRAQDKLDREVATEKANETLGRWVDTVKQNRRAEHLVFPLKHPHAGPAMGESQLVPTQIAAPTNELESTIQAILQESGLSTKNGKDEEEQLAKWEELQTKKLPLEEVMARRAELRKQRELLFREEVRAKRIKKIKSKAYRRVHRKERERLLQREQDALRADGVMPSEDEQEYNDRRRAEERMGAKHRDSKWAKAMKKSGRTVWDDDARDGITDMARRNEELRQRMEGKEARGSDDDASDFSSDGDDESEDDDATLKRQLNRLKENPFAAHNSKLASMAFMQKAEAAKKAANDATIEEMRRELVGEEALSESEDENATRAGRRKYVPGDKLELPAIPTNRSEFEERGGSDEETDGPPVDGEQSSVKQANGLSNGTRKATSKNSTKSKLTASSKEDATTSSNPFLQPAAKSKKTKDADPAGGDAANSSNPFLLPATKKKAKASDGSAVWKAQDTIVAMKGTAKSKKKEKTKKASDNKSSDPIISAPDADGWQTVSYNDQDDDDDDGNGDYDDDIENEGIDLDIISRNQTLTSKAFAGDDIAADFAAEKAAIIADEDDQIVDETLPGWGTWVGDGLSKKSQAKNRNKKLVQVKGIQPDQRKDAKLDKVIINQKRIKKNAKFLATQLPHPFETREQYERSLRVPKGKEWVTKMGFQDGTKPRVIVKGGVIKAMSKPLA